MTAPCSGLWAALVALAPLSAPAVAQTSDAEVRAEIEFARGLAAEWSFVDLAEEVLRTTEESGPSDRMAEQLDLVRCDVYASGARNERDDGRRHELFDSALEAYTSFIETHPTSLHVPSAEAAFVDTSAAYAGSLERAIEGAAGEEVQRLKARQTEVLTEAVRKTQDLITALKSLPEDERTEAETLELYNLMLNRGTMLADIGRTEEDGTYYFAEAIKALESLVFEAGEGTPKALQAFVAIGRTYGYEEKYQEASDYYQAVIEQAIPIDPDPEFFDWSKIPDREQEIRFRFLELATGGLMDALVNLGRTEEACRYGLHFYNTQKREGFNLTPFGYLSLLRVAAALLESDGYVGGDLTSGPARWFATEEEMKSAFSSRRQQATATEVALRIAQSVDDDNRGSVLQLDAQKVISDIIGRPGVTVSPEVLFEAAQGAYYEGAYFDALEGFRRVLRAIENEDQATRISYGAKVMNFVGNCYRKLERPLESALAFREGCTRWVGDVEYDAKNAQGFYRMIGSVARSATKDKELLAQLVSESERIVADVGEASRDEVLFNLGQKAYANGEYDKAVENYQQVAPGSPYSERARVEIGRCMLRTGDEDGALRVFDEYLDTYLKSADSATNDPVALAKRQEAKASAEFYRGFVLHARALKSKDEAALRRVVELLKDFYKEYPEQTKLAPWTMRMTVEADLALGDRDAARGMLTEMIARFPDDRNTASASITLYKELETALAKATDPDRKHEILREMAEHLERSNTGGTPSFANLRTESQHWMELREWAKAEGVLERVVALFEADEQYASSIEKFVKPDLGTALLEQQKTVEARAVLTPLVTDEGARPSKQTVLEWARAVIGWLEGGATDIEVVPGAGETPEEFQAVVDKVSSIADAGEKWTSCEWYQQKFMVAYAYYVWGQQDSRKLESAKTQVEQIAASASADGETFKYVADYCDSEDAPAALRASLGGGVLKGRFAWLRSKLR